jgi:tripartite-type tricarboxylate transporter receptor subunit TctC
MKRFTCIALSIIILTMMLSTVGCSPSDNTPVPETETNTPVPETEKESVAFPDKPITWIVPWKPGGANDIIARLIGPELEKELGVPVTITNTDGAGGWIGYDMILAADADGYTIGNVSLPGLVANYINPETQRKNTYRDFAPLVNFARDYVVICIHPEETRFSTFEELYEYSKTTEVTVAGTSGAGDDGVCIAQLDNLEGSQFVHLATGGSSESLTNLYGKHSDIAVANVSEVGNPLKAGQLKVIAVAAEERVPQLPEVPTIDEEIGVQIVADSSRGIVTKAGVPEEVLKILRDSLIKVLQTDELRNKLTEQGIDVQITEWEGYIDIFEATEVQMKEYGPKYFGWDLD